MHSRKTRQLSFISVSLLTLTLTTGCANLGQKSTKWNPLGFRGWKSKESQLYPQQDAVEEAVATTQNFGKPQKMIDKVSDAWPFRRKPKASEPEALAKDDPTRLDNLPGKVGPDLYVASARFSERSGNYEQALKQYAEALQADRSNRNAMIGMARLNHRLGNTEEAIRVYQQALQTHQGDPVILNDLGICYAHEKRGEEAIAVLSAAVEAAPEREMYANNLAAALVEANRCDEALRHLTQHRPAQVANYNVGFLLAQSGRREEAANYLHRALEIDPRHQPARRLLDDLAPMVSSLPASSLQPQISRFPQESEASEPGTAHTGYR